MNKLFDIACNFTSKRFDGDLTEVIEMAIQNKTKERSERVNGPRLG